MLLDIQIEKISIKDKTIIKNSKLSIDKGEIVLITGKNGIGKSTLSKSIIGLPNISFLGKILFEDKDITRTKTEERIKKGIYYSIQNPLPIDGIPTKTFLREQYLEMEYIKKKIDLLSFYEQCDSYLEDFKLDKGVLDRDLFVGFSGGEIKKLEFIQLLILKPPLSILDEFDTGVDMQTKKKIYSKITKLKKQGLSFILISHNNEIEKNIEIDRKYNINNSVINEE